MTLSAKPRPAETSHFGHGTPRRFMGREKHFKRNPWIELGFGMEYTKNIMEYPKCDGELEVEKTHDKTAKRKNKKKSTLISHDWSLKHLFPKGGQPQSPSYLMTLGQMTCWKC